MDIERILETMEYGPAPEGRSRLSNGWSHISGCFDLLIGGKWRRSVSGDKLIEAGNPATGEFLAKLTQATSGDVDDAVRAAGPLSTLVQAARSRPSPHLYALARQIQNPPALGRLAGPGERSSDSGVEEP